MILSVGFRRGNGTLQCRFGTNGREVMAKFFAMIIIVKCRQKLACPGLSPTGLSQRASLFRELVRATEPVPLVKVTFLLAF